METIKSTVVRIYLNAEHTANAKATAAALGETETWVINKIVEAGLRSIGENGGRFQLPLRFQLEGEAALRPREREAAPPKRKAA